MLVSACSRGPETLTLSGEAFGTTYNVSVVERSDKPIDRAEIDLAIRTAIAATNSDFNNWDPTSSVSRFNTSANGEPFTVSVAFLELMDIADTIHSDSGGYFDMTLAPLIELWGFFKPGLDQDLPTDADIGSALSKVGQDNLITIDHDARTLTKVDPAVTLNVSAIAKGYGIDNLSSGLSQAGYRNYMVEIGGDLFASGQTAQGRAWSLGVERPTDGSRGVLHIVSLTGQGMATSGDYRNYYEEDGIRYSHILDPRTGKPVTHNTASVSVIAENATLADGWATALLAMGSERGMDVADRLGLKAIFIDRVDGVFEVLESRAYIQDRARR